MPSLPSEISHLYYFDRGWPWGQRAREVPKKHILQERNIVTLLPEMTKAADYIA